MKYRGVILTINQNFLRFWWFLAVFSEVWIGQFSIFNLNLRPLPSLTHDIDAMSQTFKVVAAGHARECEDFIGLGEVDGGDRRCLVVEGDLGDVIRCEGIA